ncbi:hypothetical protein [Endozoicomonas sp. ONNA2]|uniref:hypothetical protein n=1 Tax=Endozoicomonas sp. ONNA2 TaxID=2828741 RepID=UPI002148F0C5|nr:hypothetical protein [Endozoicomonas sp. ONNA2]
MDSRINIQANLSRLEQAVKKMGAKIRSFDIGSPENKTIIELERAEGIVIYINDLETKEGLLHYKDIQVALFIPDHSRRNDLFDRTIHDGSKGN